MTRYKETQTYLAGKITTDDTIDWVCRILDFTDESERINLMVNSDIVVERVFDGYLIKKSNAAIYPHEGLKFYTLRDIEDSIKIPVSR